MRQGSNGCTEWMPVDPYATFARISRRPPSAARHRPVESSQCTDDPDPVAHRTILEIAESYESLARWAADQSQEEQKKEAAGYPRAIECRRSDFTVGPSNACRGN
jgi:hypothetical protein